MLRCVRSSRGALDGFHLPINGRVSLGVDYDRLAGYAVAHFAGCPIPVTETGCAVAHDDAIPDRDRLARFRAKQAGERADYDTLTEAA
jgi:hypothetical protein